MSGEVQLPRLGSEAGGAKAQGEIYRAGARTAAVTVEMWKSRLLVFGASFPQRVLQGGAPGKSSSREVS